MAGAVQIDLAHAVPFRLGQLYVEPALRQVTATAAETLEPRVMQVLVALAETAGSIISRDELVDRCWEGRIVGDDSINRVIGRLRKLAQEHGTDCFRIETIARVGYRLIGTVDMVEPCATAAAPLVAWVQAPLPARIAARKIRILCGRTVEQAVLRSAWDDAAAGHGRVVLLGGEPGIGKSFLASEIAQIAHAAAATVLYGHCDEDVPLPYRPFIDAFRHSVEHVDPAVLARHAERHRGELARLVPELRARIPDLPEPRAAEPEAERFMLFEAASGLLAEIGTHAPVVLMLDDLHWASASDLLLLKHLVRAAASLPLLIVATFQDRAITGDHPLAALLADLRREDHVERCTLGGIDEAAVVALLAGYTKHPPDAQAEMLAQALHRETSGNPFFIFELLRQLTEAGLFTKSRDGWAFHGDAGHLGLPEGIREVIGRRLRRLSPETNAILSWGAVIGRDFGLALLERVLAGSEHAGDAVLDAIEAAVETGLVVPTPGERDRYRFHHALVRATLYDGIGASRRLRMHRRIAETLEALAAGDPALYVDELAAHWAAGAGAADLDKAIDYARRAGAKATAGLAFEAAATHYRCAIEVLQANGDRHDALHCDMLIELGNAERNAGDTRFRATMAAAIEIARRLDDADRFGAAALGSGHPSGLQWGSGVDEGLVALYSEALDRLEGRDDALVIQLLGLLATELRFGPERPRGKLLSARAVAMARSGGEPLTLARALSAHIYVIDDPTSLAERLALTSELEALAGGLRHVELSCLAANLHFNALLAAADIAGAEAALARSEACAAELGVPFFLLLPQALRVMLALLRGDSDAEALALAFLQAGNRIRLPHAPTMFNSHMFELMTRRGTLAHMVEPIRHSIAAYPMMTPIRASLSFTLAEVGDLSAAHAALDELAAMGFDWPIDMHWSTAMHLVSEACIALGDRAVAAALYPQLLPFVDQVGMSTGVRCDGALAHPAGLLAACLEQWDAADAHFTQALAINRQIGARVAAVNTRRAHAAMMLRRGRKPDRASALAMIAAGEAEAGELALPAALARFAELRAAADYASLRHAPGTTKFAGSIGASRLR